MRWKLDGRTFRHIVGARRRIGIVLAAILIVGTVIYLGVAAAAGVDLTQRQVPEVRQGIGDYESGDYEAAAKAFEQGRTDIEGEEGALWLDRGLALARLEKQEEANVALRRAAGEARASKEVRSEAHFALGNLAMSKHHDFEALEEFRQALRLWPDNRDAAWNLSLAKRRLQIDSCKIVGPPTLRVSSGQESEEVTGEVIEAPRTGEAGALNGLKAKLGVGPDGSDPRADGWFWQEAEYSGEAEEGGGERYSAKIKAGPPGQYDFAFKFRQPGGEWAFCDQDGSGVNGYTPDQAGELWVEPPGNRCQLLGPAWLIVAPGQDTDPVEVALAIAEGAQMGEVEVGFGPDGSDPGSEEWSWNAADQIEAAIEAAGTIPAGSPRFHGRLQVEDGGRYDYAFRMRAQGEEQWIHCDLNGSDDGYAPQGAGDLVVREVPESGCLLDRPPRTAAAPEGMTEPIRAQLLGVGDGAEDLLHQVEVGVGPDGSSPDDEGWTWTAMESAEESLQGWLAFEAGFSAPGEQGSFDYAVRVRQDDGSGGEAQWVTCDLDGSENGYSPAMAGDLLVQESQGDDQQDQQDEEEEEQDEEEEQEEEQDEEEEEEEQEEEDEQEEEEEQLPQDMESALDALQQNERTFLPPQEQRQVRQDW